MTPTAQAGSGAGEATKCRVHATCPGSLRLTRLCSARLLMLLFDRLRLELLPGNRLSWPSFLENGGAGLSTSVLRFYAELFPALPT